MEIRSVDPRDQEWEIPHPTYRVYFFDSKGASDEYELAGADVAEVLTWAETHRRDRTFVLYACVPYNGFGLLRLGGHDPNDPNDHGPTPWFPRRG
jgi:hypothetical protein